MLTAGGLKRFDGIQLSSLRCLTAVIVIPPGPNRSYAGGIDEFEFHLQKAIIKNT